AIFLSLVAATRILGSRGALGGLWIPVTSGLFSGMILLVGVFGFLMVGVKQEVTTANVPSDTGFRWPEPEELPKGVRYDTQLTGRLAIQSAGLPLDLLKDVSDVHYARFSKGGSGLLHLRFRSPEAKRRWMDEAETRFTPAGWPWRERAGREDVWMLAPVALQPEEARRFLLGVLETATQPRNR
ncbi:MAG: hypothetical protein JO332_16935, partial [Planctomycetaceae bacterium]|nr:hypothetical protein [Planctomycetaceae bacterium]